MDEKLENILDKVFEMYNRYGIKSVTMDDVASMLGMSKKTLYQYVKDKNDLVNKVITRLLDKTHHEKECIVAKALSAIEELFEITHFMNEHLRNYNPTLDFDLRKYFPVLHKKATDIRQERIYEGISKNLEKGISEGHYRKEINIDIITRLFVSRIEHSIHNQIFTLEEITSSKVFRELMIYHLHGICNLDGVKIVAQKLEESQFLVDLHK